MVIGSWSVIAVVALVLVGVWRTLNAFERALFQMFEVNE